MFQVAIFFQNGCKKLGECECQGAAQQLLFMESPGEPIDKKQAVLKRERVEVDKREAMRSLKMIKGHLIFFFLPKQFIFIWNKQSIIS